MKKQPIVAGNWKMNKGVLEGVEFVNRIKKRLDKISKVNIIFSPPFTSIFQIKVEKPFHKAAQNCHWEQKGAFTGEISTTMIKSSGAEYVITGHSERREYFGDDDEVVNKKNIAILKDKLIPIFCIGETLEQRKSGKTKDVLKNQIIHGLKGIDTLDKLIIAYEPVWAIGTGMNASINQIEESHLHIKNVMQDMFEMNNDVQVLYGGSVNKNNAQELINVSDVDGFLIGGASLEVDGFSSIVQIVEDNQENK
jgi:triosephosphate isomerase